MQKLAVMAALLLVAAARAEAQVGSSTSEEARETGSAAAQEAQQAGEEAGQRTQEYGEQAGEQMEQATGSAAQAAEQERMREGAFDIEGKVSKVSKSSLTLSREGAASATLHVDKTTKIEVDGSEARLTQLKPGQDVKASFNLKGDKPTAIEIKAESQQQQQQQQPQQQQRQQ
jgi:hypothetical protein